MFNTYKLNDIGQAQQNKFKGIMSNFALSALTMLPEGKDKELFITKLEESMFYASRAIESDRFFHKEIQHHGNTNENKGN